MQTLSYSNCVYGPFYANGVDRAPTHTHTMDKYLPIDLTTTESIMMQDNSNETNSYE